MELSQRSDSATGSPTSERARGQRAKSISLSPGKSHVVDQSVAYTHSDLEQLYKVVCDLCVVRRISIRSRIHIAIAGA